MAWARASSLLPAADLALGSIHGANSAHCIDDIFMPNKMATALRRLDLRPARPRNGRLAQRPPRHVGADWLCSWSVALAVVFLFPIPQFIAPAFDPFEDCVAAGFEGDGDGDEAGAGEEDEGADEAHAYTALDLAQADDGEAAQGQEDGERAGDDIHPNLQQAPLMSAARPTASRVKWKISG